MTTIRILCFAMLAITLLMSTDAIVNGYNVGDKVKDFKLRNIDDQFVSLSSLNKVNGVIVIFTCNTCPFAVAYEDRIKALHEKFAPLGFPVMAINPNNVVKQPEDSFESMKKRAEEKKITFPYLYDETQETARQFGATKTPHVYLLSRSGTDFKVVYIGAIDDNANNPTEVKTRYVENAIDNLRSGKPIVETNTKAIGCSIKWKDS
jgi:peroxiredoxin